MATNRKRTPRSRQVQTLHPGAINWLYDRQEPTEKPWKDRFFMDRVDFKTLWADNRDEVLAWWIKNRPGTRPLNWWIYDAPKERVPWCQGWEYYAAQPYRQRVGGIGEPGHDAHTLKGIPQSWLGEPSDPLDPPRFESEAAYLQRHGLLTKEERAHLGKHPELLEPVDSGGVVTGHQQGHLRCFR